jgi:hypothetical protein
VLYEVAACTGLRWGELRALRLGDIDFAGGYLYVNRNWPVHGVETEPKSGKPRAAPLWDQAAAALDSLTRRQRFTSDKDYAFVNDVGAPLGYDWTAKRFKLARDAAGLTSPRPADRELTFHDPRHSSGTLAAAIYTSLREVQEYMGHASVTTTELYAHFVPRRDAAARGTAGFASMLGDAETVPRTVPRTGHMPRIRSAPESTRKPAVEPGSTGSTSPIIPSDVGSSPTRPMRWKSHHRAAVPGRARRIHDAALWRQLTR